MKKLYLVFVLMMTAFLTACSQELAQEDVVGKLTEHLNDADSYYATGTMEVDSNGELYTYNVEISYQQPNYYKVGLNNETTNNEQIILKNDEGVYVLTPALNKQFKFQSDWPLSSLQVYLYQSLLNDILSDEQITFESTEEHYGFTTMANYHGNQELVEQKITFDKDKLLPLEVLVMDESATVRVRMTYTSFEWSKDFGDDYFDSEQTMSTAKEGVVMNFDEASTTAAYPTYLPSGTEFIDAKVEPVDGGDKVTMTYEGEKGFTLIQTPINSTDTVGVESLYEGEPILVNGSVLTLSGTSMTWIDGQTEFFLVSDSLTKDDLISVYESMSGIEK